jgi:hypothetical protein
MCLALPQFVDASAGHEHIHPRSPIGRNSNGTYLFLLAVRNFPALPLESISIGSKGSGYFEPRAWTPAVRLKPSMMLCHTARLRESLPFHLLLHLSK